MIFLSFITFLAAFVNGALGYGFSSITVPLALLFLTNRALNPAIVLIEVALNLMALFTNRQSVGLVWPKLRLILLGMIPTIVAGSYFLHVAAPAVIKFWTYLFLLPLLFLQVVGIRYPLRLNGPFGLMFGGGLGLLYSLTTISGPPLALLFNNHGMNKEEFRAALAVVRIFEASLTAISYFALRLIVPESFGLVGFMLPGVIVGIPLGVFAITKVNGEVFRRVCMSFDLLIVAFGLSRCLQELHWVLGGAAYAVLMAVGVIDGIFLYRFFRSRRRTGALLH